MRFLQRDYIVVLFAAVLRIPSQKAIKSGQSSAFSGTIRLFGLPRTTRALEEQGVEFSTLVLITSPSIITMLLEEVWLLILVFVMILTFHIKKSRRSDSVVKLMSHDVTGFKKQKTARMRFV